MSTRLEEYMWDTYKIVCLMNGSERIQPGMILDVRWPPLAELLNLPPKVQRPKERAWETLQLNESDFPTEVYESSIIETDTYGKVTISAGDSLPQFGLEFAGKLETEFSGMLTFNETAIRGFHDMTATRRLAWDLVKLRKSDNDVWRWINNDFLVSDALYTKKLVGKFKSGTDITAKAAFERAGVRASGNVDLQWINDDSFTVECKDMNVPFGVRGIRINKAALLGTFETSLALAVSTEQPVHV